MNPGSSIGPYLVEAEVGSGGMGVVYRVRDPRLGRAVALKLLPKTTDPERLARFEREARILAALQHPNIAGIHSLEEAGDGRFLTMELVEGVTLAARIERRDLSLAEALDACRQVAIALEAAHEAGVVHRDLKPGNVMVGRDGRVKVLDFGLARVDEPPDRSGQTVHTIAATRDGIVLGTAAYMSPEQARGRPLDRRTDIWSFGCVLYEGLTGTQAFPGETVSDSIARILEREPDLAAIPSTVPAPVVDLVARCLEKDPKQRLRDIGEARVTLDRVLAQRSPSGSIPAGVTAGARSATPASVAGPRAFPWRTSALVGVPLLAAGVALGALVGGGAPSRRAALRAVSVAMPRDGFTRGSTILPDGSGVTVVAFPREGADDAAKPRLFYRSLASFEFRELPASIGLTQSWLAPDGRSSVVLLPASPGSSQRRLVRLALDGDTPPVPLGPWDEKWIGLTWLRNGDAIVLDTPTSFVRLAANGGAPSASTPITVEGNERVSQVELPPATHPDGGHLFVNVVGYDARGWHYAVGDLDLATGKVRRVVDDGGNAVYVARAGVLAFARGRTIFAARYDRGTGTLKGIPVPVWAGLRTSLEARPAFFRVTDEGALYYAPGGTGEGRVLAIGDSTGSRPLPIEPRNYDDVPRLAPDGRTFAVPVVNGRGIDELWIGNLGSRDLRRLTDDADADCTLPFWSIDGGRLVYKRLGKDRKDGIWMIPAAGGEARLVVRGVSSDTTYRPAGWFADGRSILVWRNTGGRDDLFRVPVDADPDDPAAWTPLTPGAPNRRFPRLSPDGRAVMFLGDDHGRFECMVAPILADGRIGDATPVTGGGSNAGTWAPDGRTLYVNDLRNRVVAYPYPPVPGHPGRVMLDLESLDLASWTPLPDGRFLVRRRSRDESNLTHYELVLGWIEDVEKKL